MSHVLVGDDSQLRQQFYSINRRGKKRFASFLWLTLASHLEKYPKHASQILLSYGRSRCAFMKMTYIQVGPSRQWFIAWILPECELDILVKAVNLCLWRQDFPGYIEKNWFFWFLRLVLSSPPHPFHVLCTSETYQQRFYLLKYLQTTGFWSFESLVFITGKVRVFIQLLLFAEIFTISKWPNLVLVQWLLSLKIWIHF